MRNGQWAAVAALVIGTSACASMSSGSGPVRTVDGALVGQNGMTGNDAAADDLVQETLVRGWSKRTTFRPDGDLRVWLLEIMHNLFVSQWRASREEREAAAARAAHRRPAIRRQRVSELPQQAMAAIARSVYAQTIEGAPSRGSAPSGN